MPIPSSYRTSMDRDWPEGEYEVLYIGDPDSGFGCVWDRLGGMSNHDEAAIEWLKKPSNHTDGNKILVIGRMYASDGSLMDSVWAIYYEIKQREGKKYPINVSTDDEEWLAAYYRGSHYTPSGWDYFYLNCLHQHNKGTLV